MHYKKSEAKFKSHYILKSSVLSQCAINDNDVSAGKSNRIIIIIIIIIIYNIYNNIQYL